MQFESLQNLLLLILVTLFGFTGTWCGLCLVRLVKRLFWWRDVGYALGWIKILLWGWLVVVLGMWLWEPMWSSEVEISLEVLGGGFLFGLGARLNNTDIFGSLGRLMEGRVVMGVTLIGMVIGLGLGIGIEERGWIEVTTSVPLEWSLIDSVQVILLVLFGLWAGREVSLMWMRRSKGGFWWTKEEFTGGAVILCGMSIGGLIFFYPFWSYPMIFQSTLDGLYKGTSLPRWDLWLIFPMMLFGSWLAIWGMGRRRVLEWRPRKIWILHGLGGILMGLGIGMVPGDTIHLLMHSGLSLSFHVLPVLVSMVGGVWFGLVLVSERVFEGPQVQSISETVAQNTKNVSQPKKTEDRSTKTKPQEIDSKPKESTAVPQKTKEEAQTTKSTPKSRSRSTSIKRNQQKQKFKKKSKSKKKK